MRRNEEGKCIGRNEIWKWQGRNLNLKDKNGNTALHKASDMGAIVLIELLCEKNIEINLKNKLGLQAVYLACVKEHYDAMRYLLSKGADINSQGVNGNTLLHHGIWHKFSILKYY